MRRFWGLRVIVLACVLVAAGCSCTDEASGDGQDDESGTTAPLDIREPVADEGEIGRLELVAGEGPVQADRVATAVEQLGREPTPLDLDLPEGLSLAVGPDGHIWVRPLITGSLDGPSQPVMLELDGEQVRSYQLPHLLQPVGITAGPDGVVYAVAEDGAVLRLQDGEVTEVGYGEEDSVLAIAAAPDGTLYVADHNARQVIAHRPDGSTEVVVSDIVASPMTVGPGGTLYFGDNDDPNRVRALLPDGEVQDIIAGDAEPEEGGLAVEALVGTYNIAATADGLYALGGNELWRVDNEGRLDLVMRRRWAPDLEGEDDNEIQLLDMAAGSSGVYVFDRVGGILYRVVPDE